MAKVILDKAQPDLSHRSLSVVDIATRMETREAIVSAADMKAAHALDAVTKPAREAGREIRKAQHRGQRNMDAPTPERAAKANGAMRLGDDDKFRIEDSELDKLFARGSLGLRADGKKDPGENQLLFNAGERYFEHVYCAGMVVSGSLDPSRIRVDGGACRTDITSIVDRPGYSREKRLAALQEFREKETGERRLRHLEAYRRAERVLTQVYSTVVNAIIISNEPPLVVGRRVSGYNHAHAATAVALDRLRHGLRILAVEFRLIDS